MMRRVPLLALGVLAFAVFLLLPTLRTGWLGDDAANSLLPGFMRDHGFGLGQTISFDIGRYLGGGRLFPIAVVHGDIVFRFLSNLTAYKVYMIAVIVLNLIGFHCLLRRLTGSATLAALGLLSVAVLFQFRVFHDPFLSFHGLVQVVLMQTLLSLIALDRYLMRGSRWWLVGAALLYLLTLLTYEISYPFFLLHATLIRARGIGWKRAGALTLPFLGAAFACAAVSFAVRTLGYASAGAAYRPNFDVLACASTFGKQLIAALPLSYCLTHRSGVSRQVFHSWGTPVAVAAAFALTLGLLLRLPREQHKGELLSAERLAWLGCSSGRCPRY